MKKISQSKLLFCFMLIFIFGCEKEPRFVVKSPKGNVTVDYCQAEFKWENQLGDTVRFILYENQTKQDLLLDTVVAGNTLVINLPQFGRRNYYEIIDSFSFPGNTIIASGNVKTKHIWQHQLGNYISVMYSKRQNFTLDSLYHTSYPILVSIDTGRKLDGNWFIQMRASGNSIFNFAGEFLKFSPYNCNDDVLTIRAGLNSSVAFYYPERDSLMVTHRYSYQLLFDTIYTWHAIDTFKLSLNR